MQKNLETADAIAKLVLAGTTVVLFLTGAIAGPFASLLMILSVVIIAIFILKAAMARRQSRNHC
jgi:hypothetical protein